MGETQIDVVGHEGVTGENLVFRDLATAAGARPIILIVLNILHQRGFENVVKAGPTVNVLHRRKAKAQLQFDWTDCHTYDVPCSV